MDLAAATHKVLDLLRQKGRAKNSTLTDFLDGDAALFAKVREDLIFNDLAEDHKGAGLDYIGGPIVEPDADEQPEPTSDPLDASPPRKIHVFISYGHDRHAPLARELKSALEERGHDAWFDTERLRGGIDWAHSIEDAIERVAADEHGRVVLLMTPYSVRRPGGFCLNEVAKAVLKGIEILPVMLVEVEVPIEICSIQWMDLRDCIPFEERAARFELKLPALIRALEDDTIEFEGGQSRILSILKPVRFDSDFRQHLERFTGREWLIRRVDEWLHAERPRQVLWITGAPGVGKTALACWLSANRREIAACHICRHGHKQKGDPRGVIRSIAWQLSTQLIEYLYRLKRIVDLREICEEADAETLFDRLLVEPMSSGFPKPDRPVVVLIDGLDEVARTGDGNLTAFLTDGIARLPSWMRLIFTSRPEQRIKDSMQGVIPTRIDAGAEENEDDIRAFLRKHVSEYFEGETIPEEALEQIVTASEGSFLYVEWIRRELEAGTLSSTRLDEFPAGLGGVYIRFFQRAFPNLEEYESTYLPVLEVIGAAQAPLSVDFLRRVLGWSVYRTRKVTPAFGALFSIHEGILEPFHRSLMEWLTSPDRGGKYYVSVEDGHKRLADYGWVEYGRGVAGLRPYLKSYLPLHLKKAGESDKLIECVTDGVFVYHYGRLEFLYNVAEYWADIPPDTLVRKCLESIERREERPRGDRPFLALCGLSLGRLFQQRGEFEIAIRCYRRALSLSQPEVNDNTTARAHFHIGWCLRYMERFEFAAKRLEDARTRFRELGDQSGEARALSALGMCHWHMQRDPSAVTCLDEALVLFAASNDQRNHAEALNHQGIIYRALGQYETALERLLEAEGMFKDLRDLKGLGTVYNSIGTAHWWDGRPDEALRWYDRADETNRKINQEYVLGLTANNRGYVLLEQGHPRRAYREFERARSIRKKLGSEGYEMLDLSGMACAAFESGDRERAATMSREAMRGLASHETAEDLRRTYFNHYRILQGAGEEEAAEARSALAAARKLVERRLATMKDPELKAMFVSNVPLLKEILSADAT